MITLTKGQKIEEITSELKSEGDYVVRLARHDKILGPILKGFDLEAELIKKGYYNGDGAIEDVVIEGPFQYLHLTRRN